MAIVQEQATRWIKQALHFNASFEAEIIALVPEIPLDWTTLPYCPAVRASCVARVGIAMASICYPAVRSALATTTIWGMIAWPGIRR